MWMGCGGGEWLACLEGETRRCVQAGQRAPVRAPRWTTEGVGEPGYGRGRSSRRANAHLVEERERALGCLEIEPSRAVQADGAHLERACRMGRDGGGDGLPGRARDRAVSRQAHLVVGHHAQRWGEGARLVRLDADATGTSRQAHLVGGHLVVATKEVGRRQEIHVMEDEDCAAIGACPLEPNVQQLPAVELAAVVALVGDAGGRGLGCLDVRPSRGGGAFPGGAEAHLVATRVEWGWGAWVRGGGGVIQAGHGDAPVPRCRCGSCSARAAAETDGDTIRENGSALLGVSGYTGCKCASRQAKRCTLVMPGMKRSRCLRRLCSWCKSRYGTITATFTGGTASLLSSDRLRFFPATPSPCCPSPDDDEDDDDDEEEDEDEDDEEDDDGAELAGTKPAGRSHTRSPVCVLNQYGRWCVFDTCSSHIESVNLVFVNARFATTRRPW